MVTDFFLGLVYALPGVCGRGLAAPHLLPAPLSRALICPPGRFMGHHENSGRDLLTGHRPFHLRIYWYDDSGLLCSTFMKCAYIGRQARVERNSVVFRLKRVQKLGYQETDRDSDKKAFPTLLTEVTHTNPASIPL
ncbi:hypothetical protein CDAR_595591 [Caerostris darwini]|uniref:Uncharacterized protein n=1 Tax=Caerostris darwini TaxID=1538125 RepID=A0AAV4P5Y5_9ARAC|nr:hypothetical protein CDAR_595591 [Caerostris darwini]